MTKHPMSGPLQYRDVKGLHCVGEPWKISTGIKGWAFRLLPYDGDMERVTRLDALGILHVRPGYLWDGSSGPTIDGKADPVPSLVHDVLYEAMRSGQFPLQMRKTADALYYEMLRERGMSMARAGLRYWALRLFGGFAASRTRGPQYPKRRAK